MRFKVTGRGVYDSDGNPINPGKVLTLRGDTVPDWRVNKVEDLDSARKAAATDKPRRPRTTSRKNQNRGIPAQVRREVFARDAGQCAFEDSSGRRCPSRWQIEFHHHIPYARGGTHDADNIELRCRAHNQYEAELEYGAPFMDAARRNLRDVEQVARPHQS